MTDPFGVVVQTATEHPTPTVPPTPESDAGLGILTVTLVLLAYWALLAFVAGWLRIWFSRLRSDEPTSERDVARERLLFREIQKTMLTEIPWKLVKRGIAWIRRQYYTRPWPTDHPSLLLGADAAGLERRLRVLEHCEGTPYSYRYEGESLNLRVPWGVSDEYGPSELHIRGRDIDGGLEVIAHVEPSRYECKQAHIDSNHVDWEAGYEAVQALVNDAIVEKGPSH